MLNFSFSTEGFRSDDGSAALLNSGAELKPSFEGRDGVAFLSRSAWLSLTVPAHELGDEHLILTLSFCTEEKDLDDRTLLLLEGVPITVNLRRRAEGFHLETELRMPGLTQNFLSTDAFAPGTWHEMGLFVEDGAVFLTLDGVQQGRRVFPGEIGLGKELRLTIGKRMTTNVSGGFHGYLDALSLSGVPTEEQAALSASLAEGAVGEFASKQALLKAQEIETGSLLQPEAPIDPAAKPRVAVYQNGAIFWSPAYGCVWMCTALYKAYMEQVKKGPVGLPVADERVGEETRVVYLLCDAGGFFLQNGTVLFVPADFLTLYAADGLLGSAYGLPEGALTEIRLDAERQVSYQMFTEACFFKNCAAAEQGTLVVLPKWMAKEYLKNAAKFGVPLMWQEGFRGNLAEFGLFTEYVQANYFLTDLGTFCVNSFTSPMKQNRYSIFRPDETIFAFFRDNDGLNAGKKFGKYKCLLDEPKTTAKGTVYNDCFTGTLVRYSKEPDKVYSFDDITFTLKHISCGSIDDIGLDTAPDLYILVFGWINDRCIENEKRWPDYDTRKNGGASFDIVYEGKAVTKEHAKNSSVFYKFPRIRGGDKLTFTIYPKDYDPVSDNDSLGQFDIALDIETGWGVKEDFLTEADRTSRMTDESGLAVRYNEMYLTKSYGDNRGGRKNIKLSFEISCGELYTAEEVQKLLKENYRKYGYWAVDNFGSSSGLSSNEFDRALHTNTGAWYDWILHFWDEIWFQAAKKSYSGKEGNCFGLSTEAIFAVNGGSYSLPLNRWLPFSAERRKEMADYGVEYDMESGYFFPNSFPEAQGKTPTEINNLKYQREQLRYASSSDDLDPGFFQLIRERHLYQLGWAHVNWIVDAAISGMLFNPFHAFQEIQKFLKRDKYCLVNCFSPGGHTMVAYDVKRVGTEDRILVADPNHPWWEDMTNKDGSYLVLTDDIVNKVELHYSKGGKDRVEKTYKYCYPTPQSVLYKKPRVPSWLELTAFVIVRILEIPGFLFTNFADFLYVISCGDEDVELSGEGKENIGIPVFSAALPDGSGQVLRFMAVPREEASFQITGKAGKEFTLYAGGRQKLFCAKGKLAEEKIVFEAKGLGRKNGLLRRKTDLRRPSVEERKTEITALQHSVAVPYGRKAVLPERFDKAVRHAPLEKRYYINLNKQKNGTYELHREGCPFLKKIKSMEYLGIHTAEKEALVLAGDFKTQVDGCRFCCRKINKG